ncbi:Severin [Gracilaria domingensis]|nr:Severin [Gracilaria domingensis]
MAALTAGRARAVPAAPAAHGRHRPNHSRAAGAAQIVLAQQWRRVHPGQRPHRLPVQRRQRPSQRAPSRHADRAGGHPHAARRRAGAHHPGRRRGVRVRPVLGAARRQAVGAAGRRAAR